MAHRSHHVLYVMDGCGSFVGLMFLLVLMMVGLAQFDSTTEHVRQLGDSQLILIFRVLGKIFRRLVRLLGVFAVNRCVGLLCVMLVALMVMTILMVAIVVFVMTVMVVMMAFATTMMTMVVIMMMFMSMFDTSMGLLRIRVMVVLIMVAPVMITRMINSSMSSSGVVVHTAILRAGIVILLIVVLLMVKLHHSLCQILRLSEAQFMELVTDFLRWRSRNDRLLVVGLE